MEIKINCNKNVSLNKLIYLKEINSKILSYSLNNSTLSGDTLIFGKYVIMDNKNKKEKEVEFEEIIPFTVVFSKENITIDNVIIENFVYDVKDNEVATQFDIIITYEENVIEVPIIPSYDLSEPTIEENIDEDYKNDQSAIIDENLKDISNEQKIVDKKINDKIDNFFQERESQEDEIENKEEEEIEIVEENNINNKVNFKNNENEVNSIHHHYNIEDNYVTVSVYFTSNGNDIEKISKLENVGIDKLYKDNEDYLQKKRIIVAK